MESSQLSSCRTFRIWWIIFQKTCQDPGGGPFPGGGVSVASGMNVGGGGKSVPSGPVSVITKVGGGGAPVPGGTSVTEDLTVGGGEPTLCGADSVNACAVTPGGGSEVPDGPPDANVVSG
jgi:hypothetical protein